MCPGAGETFHTVVDQRGVCGGESLTCSVETDRDGVGRDAHDRCYLTVAEFLPRHEAQKLLVVDAQPVKRSNRTRVAGRCGEARIGLTAQPVEELGPATG